MEPLPQVPETATKSDANLPIEPTPQLSIEPTQLPIPVLAVGLIVDDTGVHFAFGLHTPDKEAHSVPPPEKWKEIKICPPSELLGPTANSSAAVYCSAPFCHEKIKSREAHVRKHLLMILQEQAKLKKRLNDDDFCDLLSSLNIQFYCRESACYVGSSALDASKSFTRMKYLRQHYQKVHAPRNHKCSSCSKSFSTLGLLAGHMKNCGKSFQCSTCQKFYSTLEAIQTHCRRHHHVTDFNKFKEIIEGVKNDISARKQVASKELRNNLVIQLSNPAQKLPNPIKLSGPSKLPVILPKITSPAEEVETLKQSNEIPTQTEEDKEPERRKRSAETQTKSKINTIITFISKRSQEAQTLNVTKRRRLSQKEIAEAETQCEEPPASMLYILPAENGMSYVTDRPAIQDAASESQYSTVALPALMHLVGINNQPVPSPLPQESWTETAPQNQIVPFNSNVSNPAQNPSSPDDWSQSDMYRMQVSPFAISPLIGENQINVFQFEEFHQETQTSAPASPDAVNLSQQFSDIMGLVTTENETQTSFGYPETTVSEDFYSMSGLLNEWNDIPFPSSRTELSPSLSFEDHLPVSGLMEMNMNSPSYFETIDGETQTAFLEKFCNNELFDMLTMDIPMNNSHEVAELKLD